MQTAEHRQLSPDNGTIMDPIDQGSYPLSITACFLLTKKLNMHQLLQFFMYSTAQKGRRHDCLRSAVSLLGFGSIFVIGAIAGFNLKSSAGPPVQLEASSTKTVDLIPAQLTGALNLMPARSLSGAINTEVLDWRDVNNCQLMALGKEYDDDKFYEHTFGDIYCETLIPFRSSRSKLRMLEVGFGCGHHNHGRSAQGKIILCQLNCV